MARPLGPEEVDLSWFDDEYWDSIPDPEPHSADDPWWNGMRSDW